LKEKYEFHDYLKMFQRMISIEDMWRLKSMEDTSLIYQKVTNIRSCRYDLRNSIELNLRKLMCDNKIRSVLEDFYVIEATKKIPCDQMEFEYVLLTDMQDFQDYKDDLHEIEEDRMLGKIHYIFGNLVLFQIQTKGKKRRQRNDFLRYPEPERPYHVEFIPNRVSIRVAHRGIEDAITNGLKDVLCNFEQAKASPARNAPKDRILGKFQWMNRSVNKNKEQQIAIRNIVNATSFPLPYILFGPPGGFNDLSLQQHLTYF